MTAAEIMMREEKKYERYNPCCYCKATMRCSIDCEARIGFDDVITAKLEDCLTHRRTDNDWQNDMIDNAKKYRLPIAY